MIETIRFETFVANRTAIVLYIIYYMIVNEIPAEKFKYILFKYIICAFI